MSYFDYDKVAREARIPPEKVQALLRLARQEFPEDEMMCELHVLRMCMAVRSSQLTIDEAVNEIPVTKP